jgi:hypothetical protein
MGLSSGNDAVQSDPLDAPPEEGGGTSCPASRPKDDEKDPQSFLLKKLNEYGGRKAWQGYCSFLLVLDLVDMYGDVAMLLEWMDSESIDTSGGNVTAACSFGSEKEILQTSEGYIIGSFFFSALKLLANIACMYRFNLMPCNLAAYTGLHGEDLPVIGATVLRGKQLAGMTFFSTVFSLISGIFTSISFNGTIMFRLWKQFGEILDKDDMSEVCLTAPGMLMFSGLALVILFYDMYLVYLYFLLFGQDISCDQRASAEFAAGLHMCIALFVVFSQWIPGCQMMYDCLLGKAHDNDKPVGKTSE